MPSGVQKKSRKVSVPPKKCAWLDPLRAYCAEKSGDATWGDDTAMLFRAHYDAFREECVAAKEAADKDAPPKKAADPSALGTSLGKKLTKTANACAEDGDSASKMRQRAKEWYGQMVEQVEAVPDAGLRAALLTAFHGSK